MLAINTVVYILHYNPATLRLEAGLSGNIAAKANYSANNYGQTGNAAFNVDAKAYAQGNLDLRLVAALPAKTFNLFSWEKTFTGNWSVSL